MIRNVVLAAGLASALVGCGGGGGGGGAVATPSSTEENCSFYTGRQGSGEFAPTNRIIALPKAGAVAGRVSGRLAQGRVRSHRALGHALVIETDPAQRSQMIADLAADGDYEFVEEDGIARRADAPIDPLINLQWHLARIQAPDAWSAVGAGAASVPIAVIDSGIDPNHPEMAGRLLPGWNFLTGNTDTSDGLGHGTSVGGVAGAAANNGKGGAGVAWDSPLMPFVVLDSSDHAAYSDIMNAIVLAADRGVRVINVSLGGTTPSAGLQWAVDYAWLRGCIVIAAAMNNGSSTPMYPAACDKVIAVGATTQGDQLAGFSNYGSWVDLVAPGEGILTLIRGRCMRTRSGTSFSAPMVAGVAAMVLAARSDLTVQELSDVLLAGCDDLGTVGTDDYFGVGRINASRAVAAALLVP